MFLTLRTCWLKHVSYRSGHLLFIAGVGVARLDGVAGGGGAEATEGWEGVVQADHSR